MKRTTAVVRVCRCVLTHGAFTPGYNEPLRMHTADPAVPPSFSLMQGKTGGLLTMLGTSGVGDVDKVIDVLLLKNREIFYWLEGMYTSA